MGAEAALEELVETVERARYELLLGKSWDELRPEERHTRLELGRQALEAAGVLSRLRTHAHELAEATARVAALTARQDALLDHARQLDRREAELAARAAHYARWEESANAAVAAARAHAAAQAARADAAEDVIRALHRTARHVLPES